MRWPLITVLLISACSNAPNHIGNPLLLPINAITSAAENAVYSQRRGKVEVFVKSNFTAMIADIRAGSGPTLIQAMNVAGVPVNDRPARIIQLQSDIGLYETAPGALVTALMVYSA